MPYPKTIAERKAPPVKKSKLRLPTRVGVILAYSACAMIWSTTWFAVRVCVSPSGYSPLVAAALRLTVAAIIFGALWRFGVFSPRYTSRRQLGWQVIAAVASSAGLALVYTAEQWISGGMAAIINATSPIVMALVATATRIERVARSSIVGALIAMAGVLVIFRDCLSSSTSQALGVGMLLASVMIATVSNTILKHNTTEQSPLASAGLFSVVSGTALWLVIGLTERQPLPWPPPLTASMAVVYLAVLGSVVAFGLYFYLLKHVRLMTLTTLVFFPPIVALGVDALLEKSYTPSATTFLGMAITMLGVAVSLFGGRIISRFVR